MSISDFAPLFALVAWRGLDPLGVSGAVSVNAAVQADHLVSHGFPGLSRRAVKRAGAVVMRGLPRDLDSSGPRP